MTDFFKGIIAGAVTAVILFSVITAVYFVQRRERTEVRRELIEYAEKQVEIEALREDVSNRNAYEFLDDVPGVRRAADDANAEFERRRNEAVQRFRGRIAD